MFSGITTSTTPSSRGGERSGRGAVAFAFNESPAPEPEVISATRFSSETAPTLSLDAPAGWRFTHDRETGKLLATDGHSVRNSCSSERPRISGQLPSNTRATRGTESAVGSQLGFVTSGRRISRAHFDECTPGCGAMT